MAFESLRTDGLEKDFTRLAFSESGLSIWARETDILAVGTSQVKSLEKVDITLKMELSLMGNGRTTRWKAKELSTKLTVHRQRVFGKKIKNMALLHL